MDQQQVADLANRYYLHLARTLSSFRMHMAFRHNSEASSRVHNENPMSAARHRTGQPENAIPTLKLSEKQFETPNPVVGV
jgi:hypothetical protein